MSGVIPQGGYYALFLKVSPSGHPTVTPDTPARASYHAPCPNVVLRREEPRFDLRESELEQRYKQLQRLLHPDKFSTGSQLEKEYSDHQVTRRSVRSRRRCITVPGIGAPIERLGSLLTLPTVC